MRNLSYRIYRRGDISRGFFVNVSERLSPEQPAEAFCRIGLFASRGMKPLFCKRYYRAVRAAADSVNAFTE